MPRFSIGVGTFGAVLAILGLSVALIPGNRTSVAQPPATASGKTEHLMFGGTPSRNMMNATDKNIPGIPYDVKEKDDDGKDKIVKPSDAVLKYQVELGSRAYGGPIISGGRIFCGTNNEHPRNKRDTKKNSDGEEEPIDKGVLMCFEEATGKFLWQAVHDKLPGGMVVDWPKEGICSTPCVEGNRIYYVSNRCTVVCADVEGMANGNQGIQTEKYQTATDADIIWEYDMIKELGVFPHNMSACSPVIVGDRIFIVTANGVDEGHINIPSVEAPSFIALEKGTGKLLWKRADPGKNIMHGQWSNPTFAEIAGVPQVIFPGGDGWLYSFKPDNGDLLWKFDCNPKNSKYELGGTGTRNDFIGTPVVADGKIFIGVGQDPEHFSGIGHFWCIDPAKAKTPGQDLSPKNDNFDPAAAENAGSGLVWHYGGADTRKFVPRDFTFGRTMSTATVVDGVVYIAELQGYIHCLDAKTGKKYWHYDLKQSIWGSTYYVDGKVFLATEGGELYCFKHTRTPKVIDELDNPDATDNASFRKLQLDKRKLVEAEYLIARVEFDAAIRSTPVVANGVLYVMTERSLCAFGKK